ncbi:MAG: hypothetical protein IJX63_06440 [Lachnospiraceae bacterium]|nr:hypothetical protein [Lachnospiraceae bacterium]
MHKRKVRAILGLGVIIVIICGVAFFFVRGRQPEVVEEPIQQESLFINENTVTDPADVEVERHWEEVVSEKDLWLKTINDTYLHAEPFDDADTLIKVSINTDIDELACCFIGGESMGWSKVVHNGVTGYVDMRDAEYIVEDEEPAEVKALVEEVSGVSQTESIVDVSEKEPAEESIVDVETPAEEVEEVEATPTPEIKEEAPVVEATPTPEVAEPTPEVEVTPAPSAEPAPTATPNPNVTTKTAAEKQAEANALIQQRIAELGGSQTIPNGNGVTDIKGNGTHYGDLG